VIRWEGGERKGFRVENGGYTEREWKGEERKGLGLCKKPKFPFQRFKF